MSKTPIDRISNIYIKIKQFRDSGAKMKDIAESVFISSSVLSALYSTVLPSIIDMVSNGNDFDSALEESIQLVNNVSKKRFYEILDSMEKELLDASNNTFVAYNSVDNAFFGDIQQEATKHLTQANNYSGIYLSYSRSSYKDALKIEPYLISGIEKGEIMPKVSFINYHNIEYNGVAIFTSHQVGYILINEQGNRLFGLRNISLQLPLYNKPNIIKGMYLSHDFSHNPIARRIVFVKHSDSTSIEEFRKLEAKIVDIENLSQSERAYYDYTCCEGDYIRSVMYCSPSEDAQELVMEKKLLSIK